jgi:hypothetical protein
LAQKKKRYTKKIDKIVTGNELQPYILGKYKIGMGILCSWKEGLGLWINVLKREVILP